MPGGHRRRPAPPRSSRHDHRHRAHRAARPDDLARAPGWPGSRQLLRLAWRRDRILIPSSVLGLVVLAVGSAQATLALYPDRRARPRPGSRACSPTPRSSPSTARSPSQTADALAVFKTVMMGAFLTAVLGFVVVRRHTRTEEDEGRLELLGAGVVGRWAPLAAAVTLAHRRRRRRQRAVRRRSGRTRHGRDRQHRLRGRLADRRARDGRRQRRGRAAAATTTRGRPASGSATSARCTCCGPWPTPPTRAPFVHALGWLSPLGWAGRVEAYGANRTWILLLGVLTLVGGAAYRRRGPRPPRPRRRASSRLAVARSRAGRLLAGPFGLVTRLARGTIIGWTVGHGARRGGRRVAARVGRRDGRRPRHQGPARAARRHGRHGREHLRRHRDPLRLGGRRGRGHRPRAAPRRFRAVGPG